MNENETERREILRDAVLLAVSRLQQCQDAVVATEDALAEQEAARDRAYETLTECARRERAWVKKAYSEKQAEVTHLDEAATYEPKAAP